MKSTHKTRKAASAEAIARLADRGRDVSRFFTNKGRDDEPDPKGECGSRPRYVGRTGQGCQGNEH